MLAFVWLLHIRLLWTVEPGARIQCCLLSLTGRVLGFDPCLRNKLLPVLCVYQNGRIEIQPQEP